MLFARAFTPSPEARPSLATLFTSRPPGASGVAAEGGSVAPELSTLAELLGAAGFRTAAFAAPSQSLRARGLQRGFECFEEGGDEVELLRRAREWAAAQLARGERVFLWLHLGGPAPPFLSGVLGDAYHDPQGCEAALLRDRYDQEIACTAANLATFLEALQAMEEKPLERSLVVLAGVNGLELDPPVGLPPGGASLDDGALHVPLVLRHPPSLTGRRILEEVVELADLLPTVLEWFGLRVPDGARGRSLLALVDSYETFHFEQRPAFAIHEGWASARSADFRLVAPVASLLDGPATPGPPRAAVLLDLRDAPALRFDRARERPDIAEELGGALREWVSDLGARVP